MRPDVRTFSKDNPCTKRDLWECFRTANGFAQVQVSVAQSIIGINAPRVMERNGYLVRNNTLQGDYYTLTEEGRAWLVKGILGYVRNHPSEADEIENLPVEPRQQRAVSAPPAPPQRTVPGRRIRRH